MGIGVYPMLVIGHDDFGQKIADFLDVGFVHFEKRIFPDGEVCPRIMEEISDDHVVFVNRMALPAVPNTYYMETLLAMKCLRGMGVDKIDVVMPYFVYSRQDKVFRKGEPHSARYVLDLLKHCGASRFFTVVSHVDRTKDMIDADLPAYNVDGFSAIGKYLKNLRLDNPLILGADLSVDVFTQRVAHALGVDGTAIEKKRNYDTGELTVVERKIDCEGRDLVIVDDIISSGGTMMKAIEIGRGCGAKRIIAAAVHGVFSQGTLDRVKMKTWKTVTTDTVINPAAEISVAEKIAEKI